MDAGKRTKYGTGRESLVRAAVNVVARHGLHGMTFRKVAEEAGVNNSLVAHHFGSLANLAAAALEWSADTATRDSHLPTFLESEADYQAALRASLDGGTDLHVYQYEMVLEATRNEDVRQQIVDIYQHYTSEVAQGIFGDNATPAQMAVARAVFAALDGLVLQYVSGALDRSDLEESVGALWTWASTTRDHARDEGPLPARSRG